MKILLTCVLPALLLHGCSAGNAKNPTAEKEKLYPTIALQAKDTSLSLEYVADIQARKNVEIHARIGGILQGIHVDEGQAVRQGQLLFSISDGELQIALLKAAAALNSAAADARVAQVEMERVQGLVDKKIISKTELDLAKAKWNALRAKVEEARAEKAAVQKRISFTRVHAPFDGVIDRLPLKQGSLLSEGSLLTTISDVGTVLAYFNIAETEYLALMREAQDDGPRRSDVKLILADGSEYPHRGTIRASESEIDGETGSIAFRADFPNPERMLRHGASATLVIEKPASSVLMVPQKSVLEIQDKNYVFVLEPDNTARMKAFQPAQRIAGHYIVASGLKPGERIVYEGIQSIRDGEKIKPVAAGTSK